MRLGRRDVGVVELNRRACESGIGVATLAFQPGLRAVRGFNHCRVIVGFEIVFDVRLVLVVRDPDRIGGGFGGLKSVRHGERDVLAVVANDIVLERWAPLFTDAFESLSFDRAEDFSDVLAMKNSSHTGHLFRRRCVEFLHSAVSDRRLDRNGI